MNLTRQKTTPYHLAATAFLAAPAAAQAQMLEAGFSSPASANWSALTVNLIRIGLGIAFVCLILKVIHGVFLMLTHGGNEDRRGTAADTLREGFIGIIVIVISAALTRIAVNAVVGLAANYL